jgi:hypothetical protein
MASHVEPNKWYFAVDWSKCGEAIPFAEAPSPEEEPEPQFRTIKLQCPHCGTDDIYAPALMTRRQGRGDRRRGRRARLLLAARAVGLGRLRGLGEL